MNGLYAAPSPCPKPALIHLSTIFVVGLRALVPAIDLKFFSFSEQVLLRGWQFRVQLGSRFIDHAQLSRVDPGSPFDVT
jgi:hypothetical protein